MLIGGAYTPGSGDTLKVSAAIQSERHKRKRFSSTLRRRLFAGLPEEYAEAALVGFARSAALGPGAVTIDRAGVHDVDSSTLTTELAVEILGRVLSLGTLPSEEEATTWLRDLPIDRRS